MQITSLTVHPYALPLVEAVTWGGAAHSERRGALVRVETDAGAVGWGDAAPLPGFSRETLAEAVVSVLAAAVAVQEVEPADVFRLDSDLHGLLDAFGHNGTLPPSARFGLDVALADVAAQALGRTLAQALAPDPAVSLPLAGLVLGGSLGEARRLAGLGYRTLKLKVGRASVDDDARLVRAVRDAVGPGVALRLDANRAWTGSEARAFAAAIDGVALEFIEEPLRDPGGLPELWLDTQMPVALDETLHEQGAAALRGWAAAAVVKPSLVGGLAAALRIAERARAVGVKAVVSSSFESGVGLRGLVALAAATGAHAAGLDTARWLARDVLARPLRLDQPVLDVPHLLSQPLDVVTP